MGESRSESAQIFLFISIDASSSREHTRSNVELSAPDFYYSPRRRRRRPRFSL